MMNRRHAPTILFLTNDAVMQSIPDRPPAPNSARSRLARAAYGIALFFVAYLTMFVQAAAQKPVAHFEPWSGPAILAHGVDLAERNLRGAHLVRQSLVGAVFDRCDLAGARIENCDLRKSSFRGARLTGASISGSNVAEADFTDASIEDMVHAFEDPLQLAPNQLRSTRSYRTGQLRNCLIAGGKFGAIERFDFRGADLRGSWIDGDIADTDFTDAAVQGCCFYSAVSFEQLAATSTFREKHLTRVWLVGAIRGKPAFDGFVFRSCNLRVSKEATFDDAEFVDNSEIFGEFDRRDLMATRNYRRGDLSGIRFGNIDLSGFDLSSINLTRTVFNPTCNLKDANLTDAVISGAEFRDDRKTLGLTLEQIKSTWNYKQRRMTDVTLPKPIADALARETVLPGAE
jgi:uncharacterized protein YjbI with pentapeptide repeats